MIGNLKAVLSEDLSSQEKGARYVLINEVNGEIVDDGSGYGYATAHGAYKAYGYKHRDRTMDIQKRRRSDEAVAWMRNNPVFVRRLNDISKKEKVNAEVIRNLVKETNIHYFPFTAGEFSQIWKHL